MKPLQHVNAVFAKEVMHQRTAVSTRRRSTLSSEQNSLQVKELLQQVTTVQVKEELLHQVAAVFHAPFKLRVLVTALNLRDCFS